MAGPIHILVIDDDTTDRHLFRATLERGLNQVLIAEAENWTQLIDKLDDRPFDIILTDYQLRGFNGLDVIDEVRRRNCETPIIMVTGTGTEEIAIEAMQRGVHDYVLKSFKHIKRLPAMVESLTRSRSDKSKIAALKANNERFIGAFENAPYGVALIDDHGVIFQANQSISKILGYSNKALLGMKIQAITHPDDVAGTQRFHHGLFSKSIENYEHQKRYIHQKGYSVWAEEAASIVHDNQNQSHYVLLQIKDITERKRVDETLENIARGVSAATGEEFFRSLTQHLAKSLGTDYAFVCELVGDRCDQVRIIAASGASKVFDKMECSIKGSPLEPILQQGMKTFQSNVRQLFQNFSPLTDLNIESLIGATLFDSESQPLGIIAILHCGPLENIESAESMLKIFSVRASVELERQKDARALVESEQRYRTLYDENPSMFFTVDDQGILLSINQYGAEQLGYSVKELIAIEFGEITFKQDRQIASHHLSVCLERTQSVQRWEQRLMRADGSYLWTRQSARRIINSFGKPNILIVSENITEAHELSEKLKYQAGHDPLTDLLNRRAFETRLNSVLGRVMPNHDAHALCYLDLDQFKIINDTSGHVAGDELLRQLGQILQGIVRKRDTLARLGGDEFGVLLEHCPLDRAIQVATDLLNAINDFQFIWDNKSFNISASIGLVSIGVDIRSMAEVLKIADSACYVAKDKGRNQIHVYRENDQDLAQRHGEMQWVTEIHQALEEDRFHLYYQPIVSLGEAEEKDLHIELLIRMIDEQGKLVTPGSFLPAAERYNLSPLIDKWVIRAAFQFLKSNPACAQRLSLCSINLSGLSLMDDELLDLVIRSIRGSGIDAHKICFEITETAAIANLSLAIAFMNSLKELGCQFSLDDFGSGLSSFAYLKTLPVDILKIDGVFVRDIESDPIDMAMVKSINEIGHVMNKKTVAEFVENEAILRKLQAIGVDYAQGYYLGVPKPLEELTDHPTVSATVDVSIGK